MKLKGINYDIGIAFTYGDPESTTNVWNKEAFRRDLEIIRDELGCNAMRLSGTDETDMICGAEMVLQAGMDCWVSPHYIDAPLEELEARTQAVAAGVEPLRAKYPDNEVVIVYGCELHHFSPFLPGSNFTERLQILGSPDLPGLLEEANKKLDAYFARVIPEMRKVFGGRITYTTVFFEQIDWAPFDIICLDHYKNNSTKDSFRDDMASFVQLAAAQNKEFYCLETGYGCFDGCFAVAGANNMAVGITAEGLLDRDVARSEKQQADALVDAMEDIFQTGAGGIFVFTFVNSNLPHSEEQRRDLDMVGYSITKTWADGRPGSVYDGVSWDPKEAFYALKEFNRTH